MRSTVSKVSLLGLTDQEAARLTSFLVAIAIDLRPAAPVHDMGDSVRLGRRGSLKLSQVTGLWYDFEAGRGGHGAAMLIQHHIEDQGRARQYAVKWLTAHKGHGTCTGTVFNPATMTERVERYAAFARQAMGRAVELGEGSPSAQYLRSRGLPGPYPANLLGHLEQSGRMGDAALLALLTDKTGEPVAVQLGFIDYAGRKSTQIPTRMQYRIDPREACGAAFRIPATPLPDDAAECAALPTIVVELAGHILVAEGVEDCLSLHMAFPFSAILGVPGVGWIQHLEPLPKARVVVVRDGDAPDTPASKALIQGIDHLLLNGATVWVTETPANKDANDLLQSGGVAAVQSLLASRTSAALSKRGTLYKLAGLSQLELEDVRRDEAKRLGMRASILDKEVSKLRDKLGEENASPNDGSQLGPEPWDEPVPDLGEVLDAVTVELTRYIKADPEQLDTCALWCAATHLVHHPVIHLLVMARLAIQAIAPNSGKTTLLELLELMVYRPMMAASLTSATTFRSIDQYSPTMLLDEAHKILKSRNNEELVGILNASHRRKSAIIPRMVPTPDGGWELRLFSCWMTYAFTGIGKLDDQLQSRAIAINLKRKRRGEAVERLENGVSEVLETAGRKLARWAADLMKLPAVMDLAEIANREMDNWRVLLRIAAIAGGTWPDRARTAALYVTGQSSTVGDIVPLLEDSRDVFGKRTQIETGEFIQLLLQLPEPRRDWAVVNRGRAINAYWLRGHLNEVLDPPGTQQWEEGGGERRRHCRGYYRAQFSDAFRRYLEEASTEAPSEHNPGEHSSSDAPPSDSSVSSIPPESCGGSGGETSKPELSQQHSPKPANAPASGGNAVGTPLHPVERAPKRLESTATPDREASPSHSHHIRRSGEAQATALKTQKDLVAPPHPPHPPHGSRGVKEHSEWAEQPRVEEVSENPAEMPPAGPLAGDQSDDVEDWKMPHRPGSPGDGGSSAP